MFNGKPKNKPGNKSGRRVVRKPNFGEKTADKIASIMGSWKFIIIQSVILAIWIMLNLIAWFFHWDPYPFILLNLALSFQAAYAAPIIMMSQNREAARDRRKAEADLATDRKSERGIAAIQKHLNSLERNKLAKILEILEKGK
jgi:uncharacterized membrane protein